MDEEYESFDIDDRDLEYALNPEKPRRRQTKEQHIYGVWADEEDEDARPSFGKKSATASGPVRFVSSGVDQRGKKNATPLSDDDDEGPSMLRAAAAAAAEDETIEVSTMPTLKRTTFDSFAAGISSSAQNRAFAGMRSQAASSSTVNAGWASGKVANMMKKMGYVEGKGLGQNKQGIVEPVQAILRPGRGAVGAYGNESKGLNFGESAADAQRRNDAGGEPDTAKTDEMVKDAWKKSVSKRVKPRYATVDEIVRERGDTYEPVKAPSTSVKFIDMTGPENKVYDSFHSFQQRIEVEKRPQRANFDVPELAENIDQLILTCRNELCQNNDHLQELQAKTTGLEREKGEMDEYVVDAERELAAIEEVILIVDRFEKPKTRGPAALGEYLELLQQLRDKYRAEYQLFGLDCLVEFKVLPLVTELFRAWQPLDEPEHGYEELKRWRALLVGGKRDDVLRGGGGDADAVGAYDALVWSAWMPPVRRAALRWRPRDECDTMLGLVAQWAPLLPAWVQDDLLDNIVVPRIRDALDAWDPIHDEVPVDQWIVPWHHVLGDRLLGVLPQVRQKFALALRAWTPTDLTAIAVLRPWKKVFSAGTMNGFLGVNVVPKLEQALYHMNMNPTENTVYAEYNAVLEWLDLLGRDVVCSILTKSFFSRWYENICMWLRVPGACNDVAVYYKEWKERVPAALHESESIKAEFIRALYAIRQAREGVHITPMESLDQARMAAAAAASAAAAPRPNVAAMPTFMPTSFRQLVETRARELGVVFAPQPSRVYNGRTVWWFGGKSIYLDGTALFLYDPMQRAWTPVGLEQLAAAATAAT